MNIMQFKSFSQPITVFQERTTPEPGYLSGYGSLILHAELQVPLPDRLALISLKHKQYETTDWKVFTPRHQPKDTLLGHLTFALKYEGIELLVLKKLFEKLPAKAITEVITTEPNGQYARKIWFLYEWLMDTLLDIPDLSQGNYIDLLDDSLQYATSQVEISKRHRLRNNLPGVRGFCPLVRKTALLENYKAQDFSKRVQHIMGNIHPDVMARTAAFLLLKDSKASYAIEGEQPPQNRAQRWGRAIGQAGEKPVVLDELIRLQQMVIDNPRFIQMGFRTQEGFIGEHDRRLGTPIPEHISARWKDLEDLLGSFIQVNQKLEADLSFDAVMAATIIAFGFVFIHPFVDGNGRLHRYLIHHVLLRKQYVPAGMIFPVSAIILERLSEYRNVLQHFSLPRLDLVQWKPSEDNNVIIQNETADLYRYFDATRQAEFLYACVQQTIEQTIPAEADYLQKYDRMKIYLDNQFEMPDKLVALLVRFLEQGQGQLSVRAKSREFAVLSDKEVQEIEAKYKEIFQQESL